MAKKHIFSFRETSRKKHGRVSKKKTSFNNGAENYTKKYGGQGR